MPAARQGRGVPVYADEEVELPAPPPGICIVRGARGMNSHRTPMHELLVPLRPSGESSSLVGPWLLRRQGLRTGRSERGAAALGDRTSAETDSRPVLPAQLAAFVWRRCRRKCRPETGPAKDLLPQFRPHP